MVPLIVLLIEHGWATVSFLLNHGIIECTRVGTPLYKVVECRLV